MTRRAFVWQRTRARLRIRRLAYRHCLGFSAVVVLIYSQLVLNDATKKIVPRRKRTTELKQSANVSTRRHYVWIEKSIHTVKVFTIRVECIGRTYQSLH